MNAIREEVAAGLLDTDAKLSIMCSYTALGVVKSRLSELCRDWLMSALESFAAGPVVVLNASRANGSTRLDRELCFMGGRLRTPALLRALVVRGASIETLPPPLYQAAPVVPPSIPLAPRPSVIRPRAADRHDLTILGRIFTARGSRDVTILDLSETGCQFHAAGS